MIKVTFLLQFSKVLQGRLTPVSSEKNAKVKAKVEEVRNDCCLFDFTVDMIVYRVTDDRRMCKGWDRYTVRNMHRLYLARDITID